MFKKLWQLLVQKIRDWWIWSNLPWTCQHCEVLWICRNPETGKCRHGCATMNPNYRWDAEQLQQFGPDVRDAIEEEEAAFQPTYTLEEVEQELFGDGHV